MGLGYWAAVFIGTKVYQTAAGSQFSRALPAEAPDATPFRGEVRAYSLAEGSGIGGLAIPRVGLSTIVVECAVDFARRPRRKC